MSSLSSLPPQKGFLRRVWIVLWRPNSRFSLGVLVIFGAICGMLLWGGFNWAMEATNSLAFCTSCHEMRDTVYQEYQQTIHYKNRFGVRAICSDCHVPHQWIFKVQRKIQASNELLHKVLGTIGTPEKFEQHRLELAQHVWATMKATDSRECRNCHSESAMDIHNQSEAAQKVMTPGLKAGLTCIDCHQGIAHHMPKMPDEDEPDKASAK